MKYILVSSFFLISLTLQAQFRPSKLIYSKWEGIEGNWENAYQYKIILDTAYYQNGGIIYKRKLEGKTGTFIKFYSDGKVHIEGDNISVKKEKFVRTTGHWKFYYTRGTLKKEISFANGKRTGNYREMDLQGNVVKEKYYPNKFQFGFGISFFSGGITGTLGNQSTFQSDYGYGFDLGFLIIYKLGKSYSLRTFISTSFQEYGYTYSNVVDPLIISYVIFKAPIVLRYNVIDNFNIYAGIGSNIKSRKIEEVETVSFDLSSELGISYDIDLEDFTITPEFSFSYQLTDERKGITESIIINSLRRSQYYISFFFK